MTSLTPELLDGIRSRAAGYDRENTFPFEDLEVLRASGYLAPRSLLETVRDQRLLAAYAPATALAVNMHLVLWDSLTTAEPAGTGYAFTGTKIFTSLAPAWTRLGIFGRHGTDPSNSALVHGFITRDTPGWRMIEDWDTLGMRATQSHTTVLEGAIVPSERIARILPVGPSADPFIFGIFSNFLLLIGSVYAGIADRALELAVEAVRRRTSLKTGLGYDRDPDFRWRIADAALALDALAPQLESLAVAVDALVDHGSAWFRSLTGAKHRATETARIVVDQAMRSAGGGGYRASSELARLQRDVLAGIYHPSDTESVHSTVATHLLGPL